MCVWVCLQVRRFCYSLFGSTYLNTGIVCSLNSSSSSLSSSSSSSSLGVCIYINMRRASRQSGKWTLSCLWRHWGSKCPRMIMIVDVKWYRQRCESKRKFSDVRHNITSIHGEYGVLCSLQPVCAEYNVICITSPSFGLGCCSLQSTDEKSIVKLARTNVLT